MSIKNELLAYFEKNRGLDVSGQEIADRLDVSRNSIWKAVESLRADGYSIESGTNRGYRFSKDNDIISAEGIKAFWPADAPMVEVLAFDQIDSTNNEAKRMLSSGDAERVLVVTGHQTSGRGRRGREFFSPEGGLYMSLVLRDSEIAVVPTMVTMAAAVAVAHAIRELCGRDAGIKWVNDVFVDGLKVCGILTEGISDLETGTIQNIVVGIGVNLGEWDFPDDMKSIAGTVALTPGRTRNEFAASVASEISRICSMTASESGLVDEYREMSILIGRDVMVATNEGDVAATVIAIDDDGGLVVQMSGGVHTLHGGEVSVRL